MYGKQLYLGGFETAFENLINNYYLKIVNTMLNCRFGKNRNKINYFP